MLKNQNQIYSFSKIEKPLSSLNAIIIKNNSYSLEAGTEVNKKMLKKR